MKGNSSLVLSSQQQPHPRLQKVVLKHKNCTYQKPLSQRTVCTFDWLQRWRDYHEGKGVVLDSGCGTGAALEVLLRRFPRSLVLGVDRSAARLLRAAKMSGVEFLGGEGNGPPDLASRALVVREDCGQLWRLMVAQGWQVDAHFLLYPNPWPKPRHLMRRWHGHPAFPCLLALGGLLQLRSNWRVYVEEFCEAVRILRPNLEPKAFIPCEGISRFEEKYLESGHELYGLEIEL